MDTSQRDNTFKIKAFAFFHGEITTAENEFASRGSKFLPLRLTFVKGDKYFLVRIISLGGVPIYLNKTLRIEYMSLAS